MRCGSVDAWSKPGPCVARCTFCTLTTNVRWQRALGAYAHHTKPGWFQRCGLTARELDETVAAIGRALGRRLLTRDELVNRVMQIAGTSELGDILRQGWGWMLKPAAFHGQLCFAPSIGVNVRFARPERVAASNAPIGLRRGMDRPDPPVPCGVWSCDTGRLFAMERGTARACGCDVAIAGIWCYRNQPCRGES